MKRSTLGCLLLASLAAAGAAQAGTVYVAVPGISSLGAATYEVQVAVSNTTTAAREVKQLLLTTDTDGTKRSGTPSTLAVQAGRSAVVKPGSAFRGLLELNGGAELRFAARLAGTGPGRLGVYLPVISSDNLIRAGQTIALQGLLSGSGRATDLTLVNVSQEASQCTVTLSRADGTAVISPAILALKALSHRFFSDVFAGNGDLTEARATVSCTKEFFAFALLRDAATGEIAYSGPSGSGESLLRLPGEGPTCAPTALCFDSKGVVHQPTPAVPVKRVIFTPTPGTYKTLRMTMEVTVGPWWTQNPSALHMMFWLVKDKNFNMFGYLALRGPATSQALLRHGIGLTHPQKIKITEPFSPVEGKTYRLDYLYDTTTHVIDLQILDGSQVVERLISVPNVGTIAFNAGEKIVVDFGFPGTSPDEGPTFGWTYRDLHVELNK